MPSDETAMEVLVRALVENDNLPAFAGWQARNGAEVGIAALASAGFVVMPAAERDALTAERNAAIRAVSEANRRAGFAEGKLAASEMAGVVDGWRERAGKAEAEQDRLRELIGVKSTAALRRRLRRMPLSNPEKAARTLARKLEGAKAELRVAKAALAAALAERDEARAKVAISDHAIMAGIEAMKPDRIQGFLYPPEFVIRDVSLPRGEQVLWKCPDLPENAGAFHKQCHIERFRIGIEAFLAALRPAAVSPDSAAVKDGSKG